MDMQKEPTENNKIITKTLLIGAGLLIIFDFLFWDAKGFGITFGLFGLVSLGSLLFSHKDKISEKQFQIGAGLVGALILSTLIEPKPLNVIMLALSLLLFGAALRTERFIKVSELFSLLEESIRRGPWQIFRDWSQVTGALTSGRLRGLRKWKGIGASIVFGLLALAFVGLFSSANPLLSKWLDGFWTELGFWIRTFFENISIGRFFFWLLSFTAIWAYLRFKPSGTWNSDIPARLGNLEQKVPVQVVIFFLGVFNFIFLVQNVLDIAFLWGDLALPDNMSHAEYAHRGAYPLVFTALLAVFFVLVIFRDQGSSEKDVWAKRLVYVWLGQNLFLLGSACWRLILYVEAYSLTLLRAASMVWLLTVAATFVLVIFRLKYRKATEWLMASFVALTFLTLFISSFVDFNSLIAHYNVRHCREISKTTANPQLDMGYLRELGPEALPALRWLKNQPIESEFRGRVDQTILDLESNLKQNLDSDWRAWSIRRGML